MRSVIRESSGISQCVRGQIDIRNVVMKQYRKANTSDYMVKERRAMVSEVRKDIDVDSYTGATTRRTTYMQYFQDQPSIGMVYPMSSGRGMMMEPDCRWVGNDFTNKLMTQFAPSIAASVKDLDRLVKVEVDQKRDMIKQNLEQMFREKHPGKEFNFDREYSRYLKLDSEKFRKEYGYNSD